ncbi:MAG: hypothetical protein SPG34_02005 [Trueperella sp.]|uniref:hypothetical protein n=1 Tax=Trueperella sp. TaxID=2699835 RepID=UPI002A91C3AC|nr:hypothetical protein [Trueperella sp.]MDY5403100.1 hypothetical protein [Trueperella sp.]
MKTLFAAVIGFFTGMLGVVVSAGPLDLPWVGVALGVGMLAAGAWFMWEWGSFGAWIGYVVTVFGTTAWLIYFPPGDDTLSVAGAGVSPTWILIAAFAAAFPVPLAIRYARWRKGEDADGARDADDARGA